MSKPTKQPRWADVTGDVVEPIEGKKDAGWVSEEQPPAQYFNWWMLLVYQWIAYWVAQGRTFMAAGGFNEPGSSAWATAGIYSMECSTNTKLLIVPLDIGAGETITRAEFRVKPGGATNTVTCSLAVYKDDAIVVANGIGVSTAGAGWEDVAASSGAWIVGVAPTMVGYVIQPGDQVVAVIAASGGGAGARRATTVTVYTDPAYA